MQLSDALSGVKARRYAHGAGQSQDAQKHLRQVRRELPSSLPAGLKVLVSGAGQSLPVVPWIAVLDPDVTHTAQEGLYVVYLYRRDLSRVYLTMNQGATQHLRLAQSADLKGVSAERAAIDELLRESTLLRAELGPALLDEYLATIHLGARRFLPEAYEAGTIAALEYDPESLPAEAELMDGLKAFLALYGSCVEVKDEILAMRPGSIRTAAKAQRVARRAEPKPPLFRPKSNADYQAHVAAHAERRSRRHETLVADFGEWALSRGLVAATNVHPRDLIIRRGAREWLVEAKVVRVNAEHAVREAIGQLVTYRHMYYRYRGAPDPSLVALFSEAVGEAFHELLTSLDIEAVWLEGGTWKSSSDEGDPSSVLVA